MLIEKYKDRIDAILAKYPEKRSAVMPLLYLAQEEYGYITAEAVREVADICGIDPTQVYALTGFYTMFYEKPKGKYLLQVCTDLPCALRGAEEFYQSLREYLGIEGDSGTTEDGLFTLERVMCLAACDRAPVMQVNFEYHENLNKELARALIDELRARAATDSSQAEMDGRDRDEE